MTDDLDFSSIRIDFVDQTASLEQRLEAVERKLLWLIQQRRSDPKPEPVAMTTAERTTIAQKKPGYRPARPSFHVDLGESQAQTNAQRLINRIRMRSEDV